MEDLVTQVGRNHGKIRARVRGEGSCKGLVTAMNVGLCLTIYVCI